VYRDRYLRTPGAEILADLLQGGFLDSQSQIIISTVEDKDTRDAVALKNQLTKVFTQLQPNKNNLKVEVKICDRIYEIPHNRIYEIPHSRVLEIQRQDGQQYKVIFDMGMTSLAKERGKYHVRYSSYVVVEKTVLEEMRSVASLH